MSAAASITPALSMPTAGAEAAIDRLASVRVEDARPSADFLALVPHAYARRHLVLGVGVRTDAAGVEAEDVLVGPATRAHAWLNVGARLGRPARAWPVEAEALAAAIDRAYRRSADGAAAPTDGTGADGRAGEIVVEDAGDLADVAAEMAQAARDAEGDLLDTRGKAPATRLVDLILFEAVRRRASDVHVQPARGRTLVRYRLDGVLHTVRELPLGAAAAVVGRVKVMARLDVAERRAPQDGRATVSLGRAGAGGEARRVDLRVATLPSAYGERVVIRLLDPARAPHLSSLAALGMPQAIERAYLAQAARTSGIVLSTGPTGSGKTTTLYATLAWLSAASAGDSARGCELNMMTVEDPVEYDLSAAGLAVSQTQVDPKKGLTFATGLRHILRQDPDVIMVGEIRDQETARIAVQASLTGHLVLSTLHTSDAAGAVARLLDLGVEPFLVSSSLAAVLAQRLVRRVHGPCAGGGCAACLRTGYEGRVGVFELLVVDPAVRELVGRRASAADVRAAAERAGLVTLRRAGEALVRDGVTTAAEVARVIEAVEDVP